MKHLKSVLTSKRVWANIGGILVTLSGVVSPTHGLELTAAANVLTKLIDMGLFDLPTMPPAPPAPPTGTTGNFPTT